MGKQPHSPPPFKDASPHEAARRALPELYVAVTRATHQVWLTSAGSWSPILGL
jgi:hypothetical protein